MSGLQIKSVRIADIHVPDRLREIDDAIIVALSKSIELHGLMNPITVRATPNAKGGKWTLVAGAHRLRSVAVLGEKEIDAIPVQADALDAAILEIEENLWRNDLSKLDRAVFVQTYRSLWEKKHGKISRGGDRSAKFAVCPIDMHLEATDAGFTDACAERLGISKRSVEYADFIARNLPPELKKKLTGSSIADNQSALLKLAALEPKVRARAAAAYDKANGDFNTMMDMLVPPTKKPSAALKEFDDLVTAWNRCRKAKRAEFVTQFAAQLRPFMPKNQDG